MKKETATMKKYLPTLGQFPPSMLKLARRLIKESIKLFPDDEARQEEWYMQEWDRQLKDTPQNEQVLRNLMAGMLLNATKDAYERFPNSRDQAIARILEIMGWDNGLEERRTAKKALDMFLTDPLFAEDMEIRS
jgi:hypothetical protein